MYCVSVCTGDEMASRLPATGRMVLVDGKSITYAYRSLTRIMTRTGLQRKVLHKGVAVLVPDSPCEREEGREEESGGMIT